MDRHIETIPKETMKALATWSWPGNIRELENLMERSVILSDGNALHVPLSEMRTESRTPSAGPSPITAWITLSASTSSACSGETQGVISGPDGAARRLGLKRTTLQSKMQRLKITRRDYMGS